jgi:hypothetical protein
LVHQQVQAPQLLKQSVSSTLSQAYKEVAEMKEHGIVVREEEGVGIHAVKENEWVEETGSASPAQ